MGTTSRSMGRPISSLKGKEKKKEKKGQHHKQVVTESSRKYQSQAVTFRQARNSPNVHQEIVFLSYMSSLAFPTS